MIHRRHDSLTSRLGERSGRNLWRLWVEDNGFDRLRRNNFAPGTAFEVRRRPGTGLVIEQTLSGSCHVSSRRGAALLSYEAQDIGSFIGTPEIRVRIQVGRIFVTPLMRFHSVARTVTEQWSIEGDVLITPSGRTALRTAGPLHLPQTAASIEAYLDEQNLVFATELIGNQHPGRVIVRGNPVMMTVAGQFLRAAGYSETANPGEFAR